MMGLGQFAPGQISAKNKANKPELAQIWVTILVGWIWPRSGFMFLVQGYLVHSYTHLAMRTAKVSSSTWYVGLMNFAGISVLLPWKMPVPGT